MSRAAKSVIPKVRVTRERRAISAEELLVSRRWFLVYKIHDTSANHESRPRNPRATQPGWRDDVVSVLQGYPGKVDLVPPFAIHSEKGGPTRSVGVIVRSERLVGRTLQGRYDAKTDRFDQGEGPTQVPFEVA